jgi:hypothetical protein
MKIMKDIIVLVHMFMSHIRDLEYHLYISNEPLSSNLLQDVIRLTLTEFVPESFHFHMQIVLACRI